jgi:hypothetical protein
MCCMMIFETLSSKAGNPAILSHWHKLSGIILDGKPERIKSSISRGRKSISKEAGVIPTVIAEPDLSELDEEAPPRVLDATYGSGPGGQNGSHVWTDYETFRPNEAAESAIPTIFRAAKYGIRRGAF